MPYPALFVTALLALPLTALAQQEPPNLEAGQWEFTSVTTVEGDLPIPEQTETHQECITQQDIDEADIGMIEEQDGCELLESSSDRDGMDYRMACRGEGGEATIVGNLHYLQDRAEGTVQVDTVTPMGDMTMNSTIDGQRIGDC